MPQNKLILREPTENVFQKFITAEPCHFTLVLNGVPSDITFEIIKMSQGLKTGIFCLQIEVPVNLAQEFQFKIGLHTLEFKLTERQQLVCENIVGIIAPIIYET